MKSIWILICGVMLCPASFAQGQASPAQFLVSAGFVKIADGSYKVVLLMDDQVGNPPRPNFCGVSWNIGMIQAQQRSSIHNNALITNPAGCWSATSSDPKTSIITFRYFDLSDGKAKEFKAEANRFMRYTYEWRTERLLP
jgi:hypothetical protein